MSLKDFLKVNNSLIYFKSKILNIFYSPIGRIIPDKQYICLMYKLRMHRKLNLNDPKTFNEKLQWLKLYDRKPIYTNMVDKYEAKIYISKLIGDEYIIPTLGIWNNFDDIDFSSLPDQFVLKCTHDSGGLIICRDKSCFDMRTAKKKLNKCLKRNFFYVGREWPYKNVEPRIIAEKYMENKDAMGHNMGLTDYKFFCFNGKVEFLYISENLTDHEKARISFVTPDWKNAPFCRNEYKSLKELPRKPVVFDEMIALSEKLSKGISFLRVDLYEIENKIFFSELTFFPGNGLMRFDPEDWDYKLGKMLELNI